ncbi:MAG: hypothetical protein ABSF62_18010 [Bryobacteraceae bacterium]
MNLSILTLAVVLVGAPVSVAAADLDSSFQSLKDAEAKGDAALVKKLAVETGAMAKEAAAEAAPADADEKQAWTDRVKYAKDVESYTEYALYAVAIKGPAATTVDLISTLEEQNPKSKYLDLGYATYLAALEQTGAAAKIPAVVEKGLQNLPENEDLLLVAARNAQAKQPDKALGYANRLVAAAGKHTRPENVAAADWERKHTISLEYGHWIAGVIHGEKQQFMAADKDLRAALPLIKGNDAMMGPALFYLGMANYQLGKMTNSKVKVLEGAKFSEDCAKITGPFTDQAWHNAQVMKTEAGQMR